MVKVKYEDLLAAFEFVSSSALMEHSAYLSLDTGMIHWVSEGDPIDEEELPADLEISDRYVEIPHRNDLDLGKRLALRFVEAHLPHRYATAEQFFHHRGPYARFKDLLAADGYLEQWYAFESEATERAIQEWCAVNQIELDRTWLSPDIRHFFGAYFHEDWSLDDPDWKAVLSRFRLTEGQTRCESVARELRLLLATSASDEALRAIVYRQLGCRYDPRPDRGGPTLREWLQQLVVELDGFEAATR